MWSCPENCMPIEMYNDFCSKGLLKHTVYVCGRGNMLPEVVVKGHASGSGHSSGYNNGDGLFPGYIGNPGYGSGYDSGFDNGYGSGIDYGSGYGYGSSGSSTSSSGNGTVYVPGSSSGSTHHTDHGSDNNTSGLTVEKMLKKAYEYKGTEYVPGGETKKGIDCSGLIMVACGMKEKERFTTHNPEMLEKYGFVKQDIQFDKTFKVPEHIQLERIMSKLKRGDIIVWKNHHIAIYIGKGGLFHAHSSGVGETHDFERYWSKAFGHSMQVYRLK